MAWCARIALWVAVGSTAVPAARGQEPPARPKARVEFRWLERHFVKGLTEDEGIRTTCGFELSYPHKKPVLANGDVARASLRNHGSVMGLSGDHFMVSFHLTERAKEALAAGCGDEPARALAVFVDGKYWSTWYVRKSGAAVFTPQAGFIPSEAEAERIVAAFK